MAASQALTTQVSRALATVGDAYTADDYQALKDSVGRDLSDAQFRVFALAARRLNLDPFAKQIVPIKQGNGVTPQVTIDGLRLIAQRTGQYGGQIGPQWCGRDGVWHDVWLADDPPAAARVAVIRRDFREPMWGVARWKSYNQGNATWTKYSDVMLAKVAESLALRKAFPQELSGVLGDDELPARADDPPHTVEHAGRTVDADTGEVMSAAGEQPRYRPSPAAVTAVRAADEESTESASSPFANEPAMPTWPEIQKRAIAAGISIEDYPGVLIEITGKRSGKAYTAQDKRDVLRYVLGLESGSQAADAPANEPEDNGNDNGDPDQLRKLGSVGVRP